MRYANNCRCLSILLHCTFVVTFTLPTICFSPSISKHPFRKDFIVFSSSQTEDDSDPKQTIAVVGAGAVGGYYGARLWETGAYDVKFQMRGAHLQQSVANGLNVTSVHGDIFIPAESLQAYEKTEDIGPVDWVIVTLKSTSLDAIPDLIYPLLKKETRVLAIMNGLIEKDLIEKLKIRAGENGENEKPLQCCEAVYGGMAMVCCNRLNPGRIDHSYAGHLTGGVAACSETATDAANQEAYEKLWEPTCVDIAYEKSLVRGRWKKCLWNLPYNGISVAMGGITVDKIVNDPSLRQLAETVMDETIAACNADLAENKVDSSLFLGDDEKIAIIDFTDKMGPYKTSTMLDLTNRRSMEVEYLFQKPVDRARELGVPVPHLETLVAQIKAFQRFYKLY